MSEPRILAIDSQQLDAIQKCPFYTYLSFVKNWRNNEGAMPLERGDLGHFLLENYYNLIKKEVPFNEAVEYCIAQGREHYQDYHVTDLVTLEWTIKTFVQYTDHYRNDGMFIHSVEQPFSIVIYESEELIILYQGKIDLEATLPLVGKVPIDHKWRAMKADYTPLDNQFIGYAVHTGADFVYVNEVGMQKSYEPAKKFRRLPLVIGEGVKERWIKNTIQWGKILDHCLQNDSWPQSHLKVAPMGISQCGKCSFQSICNSENNEVMKMKIENEFHLKTQWDVGKVLETQDDEAST